MDIIVLIFSPGLMLFVWLVPVRANGGFSAKRQELQVERSAVDTSPIGYIAPSFVLKTPQMGILVFPQKAQIKITSLGFF
jgi:hypothetical protein